jgi:hypothetical protein
MPTGYTAAIAKGIDFKTFALDCARAFGACVLLRDEPGGGEIIPEQFDPSDYHAKALIAVEARLAELEGMGPLDLAREAKAYNAAAEASWRQSAAKIADLRQKYEAMLAKVEAWVPPTLDHYGLREFMREQIRQSIDFDCYDLAKPRPVSGVEWFASEYDKARRGVQYHTAENAKEVARANQRTAWVKALRESLT